MLNDNIFVIGFVVKTTFSIIYVKPFANCNSPWNYLLLSSSSSSSLLNNPGSFLKADIAHGDVLLDMRTAWEVLQPLVSHPKVTQVWLHQETGIGASGF